MPHTLEELEQLFPPIYKSEAEKKWVEKSKWRRARGLDWDPNRPESVWTATGLDLDGGEVINDDLPASLHKLLDTTGPGNLKSASEQDYRVIAELLSRCTPQDTLATFLDSARGHDAATRMDASGRLKHPDVRRYVTNTIKAAYAKKQAEIDSIETYHSSEAIEPADEAPAKTSDGIIVQHMHQVTIEKLEPFWDGYIAANKINILAGDPGMGKSTITDDLVARVSRGSSLPTGQRITAAACGIISGEDCTADTIGPRLIAAKAKMENVKTFREMSVNGETRYLAFPRDLEILKNTILQYRLRLLVIDPLNAFVEHGIDTHRDADIRSSVLGPMETIAEQTRCTLLLLFHLNKKEDAATLYRIVGSIGIVGAARSVLAVSYTPNGKDRVLYSLKSNLGPKPSALSYDIVPHFFISDGGEQIKTNAIQWQGESYFDPSRAKEMRQKELECREFTDEIFRETTEIDTHTVMNEAKAAGIAWRTLADYKSSFGITSKKRNGKWHWKRDESR